MLAFFIIQLKKLLLPEAVIFGAQHTTLQVKFFRKLLLEKLMGH